MKLKCSDLNLNYKTNKKIQKNHYLFYSIFFQKLKKSSILFKTTYKKLIKNIVNRKFCKTYTLYIIVLLNYNLY